MAASLVGRPRILFLDEPTTGLDPRSRLVLWDAVRELAAAGTTVLLTTQHLDEADQLADRIAVVDHGRVIAEGTATQLKAKIGGERVQLTVAAGSSLADASGVLASYADGPATVSEPQRLIEAPVASGARQLAAIVRDLDQAGVLVLLGSILRKVTPLRRMRRCAGRVPGQNGTGAVPSTWIRSMFPGAVARGSADRRVRPEA